MGRPLLAAYPVSGLDVSPPQPSERRCAVGLAGTGWCGTHCTNVRREDGDETMASKANDYYVEWSE